MAQADLSARPLGLAEVVDRSIALGLRHFRPLFFAMLLLQVPALLAARELSSASELLTAFSDPDRPARAVEREAGRLSTIAAALVALQLAATGVAATVVGPSLDPRRRRARPSKLRASFAIASATLLEMLVLALAPLLGALPGAALAYRGTSLAILLVGTAAAALGGLLLFLLVTLRLVLTPVVAALEGRPFASALLRSWRLMSPRAGAPVMERPGVRASLVLLATFLLALSVSTLAGLPRFIALRIHSGAEGLSLFFGAHLPVGLELGLSLFEAVVGAAIQPFSMVAVAVLYADRRARVEGIDLEAWAERLEEPKG